jgi:hypothetical protein
MDPNLLLWIGQILLALAFLGFGYAHSIDFERTPTSTPSTMSHGVPR